MIIEALLTVALATAATDEAAPAETADAKADDKAEPEQKAEAQKEEKKAEETMAEETKAAETKAEEPAKPAAPKPPATTTLPVPWLTLGEVRVRPRLNLRVRADSAGDRTLQGGTPTTQITHRARIGATVQALQVLEGVVEVQDVRLWGAEIPLPELPQDPTLYGTVPNAIELHQAWIALKLSPVELRVGRQEISIGAERIIGAVDFSQRARAFDAVRLLHQSEGFTFTAAGAVLSDAEAGETSLGDRLLVLAAAEHQTTSWLKLQPIAVYDNHLQLARHRGTAGLRVDGKLEGFSYDVEAYAQATALEAAVSFAWLGAARASYGFDTLLHPRIGGLVDVVSGTDDGLATGGFAPFDTLFATNHKFYGFVDMFLNLPLHTQGHGIVDVSPIFWAQEGPVSLVAYGHVFLPYAPPATSSLPLYGVEPDLVVQWKPWLGFVVEGGGGLFVPVGDALGRGDQLAGWVYGQAGFVL